MFYADIVAGLKLMSRESIFTLHLEETNFRKCFVLMKFWLKIQVTGELNDFY